MDEEPSHIPDAPERLQRARSDRAEASTAQDGAPHEGLKDPVTEPTRLQAAFADPFYSYTVALALSLGLTPLAADARYVLLWTLMLALGAGVYLFGEGNYNTRTTPNDLVWGGSFGLLIGVPALALLAPALALTSAQLFPNMSDTSVYLAVVFALPLGETLLFRAAIQEMHGFRAAALTGGGWSLLLFLPHLTAPVEALVIGITMFALSFAYTYVRQRNGLAAAWLCQVIASVFLLFLPRLG